MAFCKKLLAPSLWSFSADAGTFPGDFGTLFGDFGTLFGDFGTLFGDFGTLFGDFGTLFGDFGTLFGDFGTLFGDFRTFSADSGTFSAGSETFPAHVGIYTRETDPFRVNLRTSRIVPNLTKALQLKQIAFRMRVLSGKPSMVSGDGHGPADKSRREQITFGVCCAVLGYRVGERDRCSFTRCVADNVECDGY